jgi:hypothetical protein
LRENKKIDLVNGYDEKGNLALHISIQQDDLKTF